MSIFFFAAKHILSLVPVSGCTSTQARKVWKQENYLPSIERTVFGSDVVK